MASSEQDKKDLARVIEDAEDGLHGRLDDPHTPPETGPIERGRVDGGPTAERADGFREPEPGSRIALILGIVIAVIIVVLLVLYLQ